MPIYLLRSGRSFECHGDVRRSWKRAMIARGPLRGEESQQKKNAKRARSISIDGDKTEGTATSHNYKRTNTHTPRGDACVIAKKQRVPVFPPPPLHPQALLEWHTLLSDPRLSAPQPWKGCFPAGPNTLPRVACHPRCREVESSSVPAIWKDGNTDLFPAASTWKMSVARRPPPVDASWLFRRKASRRAANARGQGSIV